MRSETVVMLLYLVGIPVGIYLLFIRPQRNRARKTADMQSRIEPGTDVMLTSGIYGTVVTVEDAKVHVAIADGVVIAVDRRAVGLLTSPAATEGPAATRADDEAADPPADGDDGGPREDR